MVLDSACCPCWVCSSRGDWYRTLGLCMDREWRFVFRSRAVSYFLDYVFKTGDFGVYFGLGQEGLDFILFGFV